MIQRIETGRKMDAARERSKKGLALLCAAVLWTSGCLFRQPPRASIVNKVSLRPPVVPTAVGANLDAPPEIPVEAAALPELVTLRSAPPRPRVTLAPAAEPAKPEAEPEPRIAPEISTAEVDAAQAETRSNLDAMQKNLALASGKPLNASQQDLISKVRGFAKNAREAMRSGDWVRAKNLSKKAEVLSEELAGSL